MQERRGARIVRHLPLLATSLVAILAAGAVIAGTRWGPWAFGDSVAYIGVARTWASGNGLGLVEASGDFRPLSHFPPLYPMMLGILTHLGLDAIDGAKWIDVASVFAIFALVGAGGTVHAHRSAPFLALAILALSSVAFFTIFTGAISEPPFLSLAAASMACAMVYMKTPRAHILILGGALAGLCGLARYTGIAVAGAGALMILLLSRGDLRQRLGAAAVFGVLGLSPLLVWTLYLKAGMGASPRGLQEFGNIWGALGPVRVAYVNLTWQLLPIQGALGDGGYRIRLFAIVGGVCLLLTGTIVSDLTLRRRGTGGLNANIGVANLAAGFMGFALMYGLVVALAYITVDPRPDLTERVLFPLRLGLAGGLLLWIYSLAEAWLGPRAAGVLVVLAALAIGRPGFTRVVDQLRSQHESGLGYTSREWRASATIEGIRTIDPRVDLITNDRNAVLLWTERAAFGLPELEDQERVRRSIRFGDGNEGADLAFREGGALVLFDSIGRQLRELYGEHADDRLHGLTNSLVVQSDFADGTIYLYSPGRPSEP